MFDRELKLFQMNWGILQKLLADFTDEQLAQPVPGAINPAAFTLGHVATTLDFVLTRLGAQGVCPSAWHDQFAPGRRPDQVTIPYPTKAELLSVMGTGVERICAALPNADPVPLEAPHGIPFLKESPFVTVADALALVLTNHFALHNGQISLMRRQLGGAPLF